MQKFPWLTERPIAHRGYHDLNRKVWENTLSAFARAADAGFAIECDLQYAADAVPVVFHDDDLKRLCGIEGDVRQRTAAELGLLKVGGTEDGVPTLRRLLDLVKGRVPLVLELKGREGDDDGFAMAVLDTIEDYDGPVALMSFDHWLLKDLTAIGTSRPVGLTAEGARPENFAVHEEAMQLGLDFISYHYGHLPNAFISRQRDLGRQVITWTVRDDEARTITALNADQMTFEGFDPREALTA
ncbi:glycerophosphodiester phosphodiesterase [Shinella sp. 838]|jgi:glycerophosphoryl diester phosphodiesterase|uniref:glycerophosphodiester phosphodiesterase n=1 Tax=unclassified Shinella TaxID=2643062 RepID=UPI0003C5633B|nr:MULTISPECIES: glycerophosphodiester phosphodiesterase [unclassified Shinella]EYR79963.1 glycerophosphoryl diester phosphodiesterase [Shinella sp. DD12]MCA0345089.1 glycerophosphodiester phosphodiesterase [Pseudomonadota bacterium]MDG4670912.1 glycerophosphodiester phosphodiesterase [Shinella sp. 838]TAA61600.1 glycerophosphodiester phosphodiesterase [Shinella sp. JR1-6]